MSIFKRNQTTLNEQLETRKRLGDWQKQVSIGDVIVFTLGRKHRLATVLAYRDYGIDVLIKSDDKLDNTISTIYYGQELVPILPPLEKRFCSIEENQSNKCTATFTGKGRKDKTAHQISQENDRLTAKVNELERKLAYTELDRPSQNVIDDLIRYRQILPPEFWSFDKIEKLVEIYDKMKEILGENV